MARVRTGDVVLLVGVAGLPLAGAAIAGRDLGALFHFPPPVDIPDANLRFSWLAAGGVAAVLALLGWSWVFGRRAESATWESPAESSRIPRRFPVWGWAALAGTAACWVLAWTRWPWFESGQRFTFFPLWLGFIVTVNAATQRRAGTCLMLRAPGVWLALFGASAVFWWGFEWLNRFVRNWHYLGGESFSAAEYALNATLCFSTVLPAVAAVAEWLETHPGLMRRLARGPAWTWLGRRDTAVVLAIAAAATLLGTGARPVWFYAALWVAPLAWWLAGPVVTGRRGLAHEIAGGDWRRAGTWMLAALACGFFWELWNWRSFPKWIYSVPGVERWHVFEMPLLGYAGYLPFGLECLVVAERILRRPPAPPAGGMTGAWQV